MPTRQRTGTAITVLLGVVIAIGAVVTVVAQPALPVEHKLALQPATLAATALASPNRRVNGMFAVDHLLHDRIAGARIRVPMQYKTHRWGLQKVARLTVELTHDKLELPRAAAKRLIARADATGRFTIGSKSRPIHFLFEDGQLDYVIATTAGGGPVFVLPEHAYTDSLAVR